MKTVKITYEAVFNVGNYQSIRMGGEYTLEKDETAEDAYRKIDASLRAEVKLIVADRIEEQKAVKPKPEVAKIHIGDDEADRISQIGTKLAEKVANGMSAEEVLENVRKYYDVSDKVFANWEAVIKLQEEI